MMKRIFYILLALFMFAVSLAGCGSRQRPDAGHPVTLTMWHVYGSQTRSPLNDAIDTFNDTVGRENGVTVNVVSVTSSSAIDKALLASANGEPGAEELPDLFTAYPRVAEIVGEEELLCWNDYFSEEELALFRDEFIDEGCFGDKLLMLPIAKSSEALFLNRTLFDRFADEADVSAEDLLTFEGFFDTANLYYDWSDGQNFTQINDFYNYAFIGMAAHDSALIEDGLLNLDDDAFEKVWYPLSRAAIYGGICLDDGYAASRWKTVEIISNIGSTADILYQPEMVFYPDNTTEPIESLALPYPRFKAAEPAAVHRGGGLFAVKSEDERKNYAAVLFAKWLTEDENNLQFVTSAGYLPVTDTAFEALFDDTDTAGTERFSQLYDMMDGMMESHTLLALPRYAGASDVQIRFEQHVKQVLKSAHSQYTERTAAGEDKAAVLDELAAASLAELRRLSDKDM
ncbi:MAG: carbohydrate ABC transporter substrate-binding protein [Oscillospiraceae bacterium]|nr:carbohydrate ABC transporter substrate-binding protein [Oscillospiraceae bacterium]